MNFLTAGMVATVVATGDSWSWYIPDEFESILVAAAVVMVFMTGYRLIKFLIRKD